MKVQLENGNKSPYTNWKYNSNQKMEIIENDKSPIRNWIESS